jgi:hypothetical protein
MEKTAMMELIEFCEQQAGVVMSEDYRLALEDVVSWANKHYLPKEKTQIVDAFSDGLIDGERYNAGLNVNHKTANDYYTQTYHPLKQE